MKNAWLVLIRTYDLLTGGYHAFHSFSLLRAAITRSNDRLVTTPPPTARLLLTLYCNHLDPLLIAGRSRCGFHCGRCHPAFPKTLARNLAQGRISDVAGLRAPPTFIPELLRADLPRRIRRLARRQRGSKKRRRFPIAIDLHGEVCYKRNQSPPEHARKGKRVGGTNYGHCYGTASLLLKGQYYIIALTPYQPREALVEVVKRLLRQTQKCGFSPKFVLCDGAFWSVAVFRYLKHAHYPFLTPVLSRGKKIDAPGGPTGTRIFFYDHPRGRYAYRMENRKRQGVWLTIVVSRHNRGGRKDQHGRYAWVYAIWGMAISTIQGI